MKIFLVFFLFFIISFKFSFAQNLTAGDSLMVHKILNSIDSNLYKIHYSTRSIPKFIIEHIENLTDDKFRITSRIKKYNPTDTYSKGKSINRLLFYVASFENFILIAYEFGGFMNNTHLLFIQYNDNKISSLINFIIPNCICLKELPTTFKSLEFPWIASKHL